MVSSQPLIDENRGPHEVVLIVVLTIISTIFVMLRVYSKIFVVRSMGWDDGMMIVAVVRAASAMDYLNMLTLRPR